MALIQSRHTKASTVSIVIPLQKWRECIGRGRAANSAQHIRWARGTPPMIWIWPPVTRSATAARPRRGW